MRQSAGRSRLEDDPSAILVTVISRRIQWPCFAYKRSILWRYKHAEDTKVKVDSVK